jgi:hypothetical protein
VANSHLDLRKWMLRHTFSRRERNLGQFTGAEVIRRKPESRAEAPVDSRLPPLFSGKECLALSSLSI